MRNGLLLLLLCIADFCLGQITGVWSAPQESTVDDYIRDTVVIGSDILLLTSSSDIYSTHVTEQGTLATWTLIGSAPEVSDTAMIGYYNGYLYVVKGITAYYTPYDSGIISQNWLSQSIESTFESHNYNAAFTLHNGFLYVSGGVGNSPTNDGSRLVKVAPILGDGSIGVWQETTSFSRGRGEHKMIAHDGFLYVLGGRYTEYCGSYCYTWNKYTSSVEFAPIEVDGTLGSWTTTANCGRRALFGISLYDHKLYVAGGFDYDHTQTCSHPAATDSVKVGNFSLDGNITWESRDALPQSQGKVSMAVSNENVFLFTGFHSECTTYSQVNGYYYSSTVFDLQTESIIELGTMWGNEGVDLDGDGVITILDLLAFIQAYGSSENIEYVGEFSNAFVWSVPFSTINSEPLLTTLLSWGIQEALQSILMGAVGVSLGPAGWVFMAYSLALSLNENDHLLLLPAGGEIIEDIVGNMIVQLYADQQSLGGVVLLDHTRTDIDPSQYYDPLEMYTCSDALCVLGTEAHVDLLTAQELRSMSESKSYVVIPKQVFDVSTTQEITRHFFAKTNPLGDSDGKTHVTVVCCGSFEPDSIVGTLIPISAGTFTQGSPTDEPCRSTTWEEQFTHTLVRDLAGSNNK